MSDHTDAYKNFEANIKPLIALFALLKAGVERSTDSLLKSVSRHRKIPEAVDSFKQTKLLAYTWIPVMLITFIEAFLEDGLSELARRHPKLLLRDGVNLDHRRIWEVDSLEDLRAELRQQWAGGRLKGGPKKWVEFLQRIGGPAKYKNNCLFYIQHLWDVRNLIVHAQGKASPYYVKKYPSPALLVGTRILVGISSIEQWVAAFTEFVESTEQFFLLYAADKKAAPSHE